MKTFVLPIVTALAFAVTFKYHIAVAMYALSAVIFYLYVPQLYVLSRVNILQHAHGKEFLHLKYYPMELTLWLLACSFFAFIIAHLLADLLFNMPHLHHFMFFLMMIYLGLIIFREIKAKKLYDSDKQINYVQQGRLLSFEMLFVYLTILSIPH